MTRTFWLSFVDADLPAGQRSLGVAVVDLDDDEIADAATPPWVAGTDAEWCAAAIRKAWAVGCNPGGEVLTYELPRNDTTAAIPRNRLMARDELSARGLA